MRRVVLLAAVVVAGTALAAVVAARAMNDSADAPAEQCDVGLGSYQSPLDGELLARARGDLEDTAAAASADDLEGARTAFFPFAHALVHQVDTRLRDEGKDALAERVCETVLTLESDFVLLNVEPGRVAADARALLQLVARAAQELGLDSEGGEG